MEIIASDLDLLIKKLVGHIIELGVNSINLPDEYYWHIPKEELNNAYKKPVTLDLGRLSDDWCDLREIIIGERDPLISDFIKLAAILRIIGETGELI
jgi:hypothetical protein